MKNEKLFEKRNFIVGGAQEDEWVWQKADIGGWNGPFKDWNNSHYSTFTKYVRNARVVVTAGGNHGMYVRPYSNIFEKVYAFEPDWLNFHAMVRNTLRENVFCFRAALGDSLGMCKLVQSTTAGNTGMHKVTPIIDDDIPVMMIDMLKLQHCDLIQLDVEEYEYKALLGASWTIRKYSPTIIVENSNYDIVSYLNELGYNSVDKSMADTIFVREKR